MGVKELVSDVKMWVYVLDEFKPVEVDVDRLLEMAEKEPLRIFNSIRKALTGIVKEIKIVRVHDTYFNPDTSELVIEYLIESDIGNISVKFIHSSDPSQTLINYYKYEAKKHKQAQPS